MKPLSGFICLYRKLLDWDWHDDPHTLSIFIHLLLLASWKDTEWRGKPIKRGQLIASRSSLAKQTGLSERQVRTSLRRLKESKVVTIAATKAYSLITIENYRVYQDIARESDQANDQDSANETTSERPTARPHLNNMKQIEQERGASAPRPPRFTPPALEDVEAYCTERGNHIDAATFIDFYAARGWKLSSGVPMKDWRAAVRTWERREQRQEKGGEDDDWHIS